MNRPISLTRRKFTLGLLTAGAPKLFAQTPAERAVAANAASFLVHVSSSESREIYAFIMDARTGDMELLEVVAVPGTGAPTRGNLPLAWDRDHKVLYAQNRIAPFPLSAYALNASTGRLSLLQTVPLTSPMAYLTVSRDGKFLLSASYDDATLQVNLIDADGRVAVPAMQTISTAPKPHCIVESPAEGFVYATTLDGDVILVFRKNPDTGRLEQKFSQPVRKGAGPRHLVFHPKLNVMYSVNEYAGSVTRYSLDPSTGEVRDLQYEPMVPTDLPGTAAAADIHLTPDGRFLYASVRRTDELSQFRIDPVTGAMSKVAAFKVEAFPRGFNIDPTGRFLLCAGQESNHVGVYALDPADGGLTLKRRYPAGKRPGWVEFTPWSTAAR